MKNVPELVVLAMLTACFCAVNPLYTERATAKYNQDSITQFPQDLNLSADQQQKLEAINTQYAAEQAKLDQKLKELKEETANPKDSSFYVRYGQQAGVHGTYFERNPEAYLKACRSAYFRNQKSALFKRLGELSEHKQEKTMAILTPEQRTKWVDFYRDMRNK
jgi:Spy/CpxP family protein refolding chaperone